MIETNNRPLNVEEAADFLGYTKSYVYRLVHEKRIAYYKPGGSRAARVFFKQEDLEKFIFRGRSSADYELHEKADELLNNSHAGKKIRRSRAGLLETV